MRSRGAFPSLGTLPNASLLCCPRDKLWDGQTMPGGHDT